MKPERVHEYKERHQNVWPEMIEALRRNGWHRYSLFMGNDGELFGYFETPENLRAAVDAMSREEINKKWQDSVAPFFEGLNGNHADEAMMELEEVFHLD